MLNLSVVVGTLRGLGIPSGSTESVRFLISRAALSRSPAAISNMRSVNHDL